MKRQLSSLDIRALLRELRQLEGSRLEKAYHFSGSEVLLRFKGAGERAGLHISNGKYAALTATSTAEGTQPTSFAMLLRKHLGGAVLTKIGQRAFDRIIILSFSSAEMGDAELVIELSKEGNVLLVKEGKIVQPLFSRDYGRRALRAKLEYVPPPLTPDPATMTLEEFGGVLSYSRADIVRTLATRIGLGGTCAEEVCLAAGIDKNTELKVLQPSQLEALHGALKALLAKADGELRPSIIIKDGVPVDVIPFDLGVYKGAEREGFGDFSSAIVDYFLRVKDVVPERTEEGRASNIEAQQAAMATKLSAEAERTELMADSIYVHFTHFQKILEPLKGGPMGKALVEALKGLDPSLGVKVLNANLGTIEAPVPGTDETVVLQACEDIYGNASRYYEAAKTARSKLEGVMSAMKAEATKPARKAAPATKRRRKFWFERYRWFVTSDGHIAVAGRDARMNEEVVKKHVKNNDRYAHADVQGAPSVALKAEDLSGAQLPGFTEQALEEACEFSLVHSKAWNAGLATGSAYWVLPDQVSKTPNPGEFLPKGAFVIRGKRNYARKIAVKAALGAFEFNGERVPLCGPESAVAAHTSEHVTFVSGERNKAEFAKEMARRFDLDLDDVMRALPPGDVRVV
ncbi:MAG: NFACT family protein [Euryarchaeota archaeon]|nr:NFACT family protein [Euryarchaeota archaeon]